MKIATAVVIAHDDVVNPEPGVARAPTVDEQIAAIEMHAVRHGLLAHSDPVVLAPGELPPADLPTRHDGVICSTLAALQRDGLVSVELLDAWRVLGRPIGFLVEDLWFTGDESNDGFDRFRLMVVATNLVRGRAAPGWAAR